jgi:hypothetical protein
MTASLTVACVWAIIASVVATGLRINGREIFIGSTLSPAP